VSKAFTREDDAPPAAAPARRRVPIPEGVPNYITADGARALRAELASGGDGGERAQDIADHLACAEIVVPVHADQVRFGSTVETSHGTRYRIVGAIEADPKQHAVFWQSPIARALLGARVGDEVRLPSGVVEIVSITS
jgi:transcription elongation GreA/GreB family factor